MVHNIRTNHTKITPMASFTKRGNMWRASVFKLGIRKTATFPTKSDAVAWATKTESDILSNRSGEIPNKTFGDLLTRYAEEVSPKKRGTRWEQIRIKKLMQMPIGSVRLKDLRASDFVEWREARRKEISDASVSREMALLSHACGIAIKEWEWLRENPMRNVSRPKTSKPRDRLISDKEIERLLFAVDYDEESQLGTAMSRVGAAFLFAIETAMRAGEIVGLTWDDVNLETRVARLTETKNGSSREVPLSTEAIRILEQLRLHKSDTVFGLTSSNLDALFRKAKSRALIDDLHFHDTRHEAITRLAKKLDVLELARMVGHRDLKMLMVYYNETAEALAKKLA